jgi:hypothetical protein
MIHFRIRFERLQAHLGSVRRRVASLRSAWLAMLLPLAGLLLQILGGPSLSPRVWLALMLVAFVVAWRAQDRRARRHRIEGELDRRYGLGELLVTAVEVDARGVRSNMESRLLDDAASAVARLGTDKALSGPLARREAETLVGTLLCLMGLWLLAGSLGGLPQTDRLPGIASPDGDRSANESEASGPEDGSGYTDAGSRLAGALGDHAAAREIADALAAGRPDLAARAARSLADRAGELSEQGRGELAESLGRAADETAPFDPDLAEALRSAKEALEAPDSGERGGGIERLASELEGLEDRPPAEPAVAQARAGPPLETLGGQARRLDLSASKAAGQAPAGGRSLAGSSEGLSLERLRDDPSSPGLAREGRAGLVPLEQGGDPLRYPWPMRDALRRYFAPMESGR